jgi:hypothetical protein
MKEKGGSKMKPDEKAAEKWAVERCFSRHDFDFDKLVEAFLAGAKWRHDNADCEGCYKKGIKEGYAKAKKEVKVGGE